MTRIQVIAIVVSILLLVVIVELVRQKRLGEGHCILWLLTGTALLVLSLWGGVLEFAAGLLGIYAPPMVLLVSSLGFFILILLHFSTVISQQTEHDKELAQRLAILQLEVDTLKKNAASHQNTDDSNGGEHGADFASSDQGRPVTPLSTDGSHIV